MTSAHLRPAEKQRNNSKTRTSNVDNDNSLQAFFTTGDVFPDSCKWWIPKATHKAIINANEINKELRNMNSLLKDVPSLHKPKNFSIAKIKNSINESWRE